MPTLATKSLLHSSDPLLEWIRRMTPQSKQILGASLLEIQRRKEFETQRTWTPTKPPHNDQLGFFECGVKEHAAFGGNRSGKTLVGLMKAIFLSIGEHPTLSKRFPPPVYGRIISTSWEQGIQAVILKQLFRICRRDQLKGRSWDTAYSERHHALSFENGSEIRFFSSEQTRSAFGGDKIHWFMADEHIPYDIYLENYMRLTDFDGIAWLTMSPELGLTWEYDKILNRAKDNPDKVKYWFFSTYDNPYLSQEVVKDIETVIGNDTARREAKLYGRFVSLAGLVYPMFNNNLNVREVTNVPASWPRVFAINPHKRQPTTYNAGAWSPDKELVIYQEGSFEPSQGGVPQLAAKIKAEFAGQKIWLWLGDDAEGGEGLNIFGERSVIEQLKTAGLPIYGTNQASDKTVDSGVWKIKEFLMLDPISNKPRLTISKSCPNTIREFNSWQYRRVTTVDEELGREKYQQVNKEYLDNVRYIVMAESMVATGNKLNYKGVQAYGN